MGMMIGVFFALATSVAVVSLGWVLSWRVVDKRSLSSPFECGFDPLGSSRVGFSLRFFLVLILFVVFDFETVLLMPSVFWLGDSAGDVMGGVGLVSFLVVLLVGVLYEMKEGALEWKH